MGQPPVAVTKLELPQESSICDFSCCSPENPDTLYLEVVGVPPFPKRTITNKIYLCNCDENYEEYKYKREVDCDGEFGTFLMLFQMRISLTAT